MWKNFWSVYEFSDLDLEDEMCSTKRKQKNVKGISLAPFGAVTYKMQEHVWVSSKSSRDHEKLISLESVADSWLKQLRVQHHDDFIFFTRIRHVWWLRISFGLNSNILISLCNPYSRLSLVGWENCIFWYFLFVEFHR